MLIDPKSVFYNQLVSRGLPLILLLSSPWMRADDSSIGNSSNFLPEEIGEESFTALKSHSPFSRTLGLSDTVVLTGMARIEREVYATLFDTDTTESHLVTDEANTRGWQLVDVQGEESDLESLTAKIQVEGGEVVSIRYEQLPEKLTRKSLSGATGGASPNLSEKQKDEARREAVKFKGENSADGYKKLPPPEVVRKLSQLSLQQRETINREMLALKNRGLGLDQRRDIYNNKIDQALRSRR